MLRTLKNIFGPSTTLSSTSGQELRDIVRGLVLDRFREIRMKGEGGGEVMEQLNRAESEIEHELSSSSLYAHRLALQQVLNRQSNDLMRGMSKSGIDESWGAVGKKRFMDSAGFYLRTSESTVSGAGDGLFVEGDVMAGTVIGYFPGLVWLAEHLKTKEGIGKVKDDKHFQTMMRFDECIIDSRPYLSLPHPVNPLALCHYINHPPPHSKPNVLSLPLDFNLEGEEDWEDIQKFIPNEYALEPSLLGTVDRTSVMLGMVVMATRDIYEGEEVFVNYRFNPKAEGLPEWYVKVEDGEDEMRWADYKDL